MRRQKPGWAVIAAAVAAGGGGGGSGTPQDSLSARTVALKLLRLNLQSAREGAFCKQRARRACRRPNTHPAARSPVAALPAAWSCKLQRCLPMSRRPGRWEAGNAAGGGQGVAEQPIHLAPAAPHTTQKCNFAVIARSASPCLLASPMRPPPSRLAGRGAHLPRAAFIMRLLPVCCLTLK